jgi:acyl dehydratase/NADP-dependent 3-hydroxy acid dehydrogenase YdfG
VSSDRTIVASRAVSQEMQERFANLSGDRNPMHMDPVAARRTQAGEPVVHGVHTLLWSLDSLLASGHVTSRCKRIRVKFLRWVYLGDKTVLRIEKHEESNPRAFDVEVHGLPVLSALIDYSEDSELVADSDGRGLSPLAHPLDLTFAEMTGRHGTAFVCSAAAAREAFPRLTQALGARCVAEIASCSYVVGMEAPGLHSMFSKLDLTLRVGPARTGLDYEVNYHDERFRKARIGVVGSAIEGTLEVFVRVPPVEQASMEAVASLVEPAEFAGMRALIIGGSRGLGEATAKIIAAGGGETIISYAVGKRDAEILAATINAQGGARTGTATTLAYDVRKAPAAQIAGLGAAPTHLFYFATNAIFRPKYELYSAAIHAEFALFYVRGFYDLCKALTEAPNAPQKLLVYYPSSVAVEERPEGMTEYSMTKAAGELLCADMNLYMPQLHVIVSRLPRLPTDQTAGVIQGREVNPLDTLLPLVRKMKQAAVENNS